MTTRSRIAKLFASRTRRTVRKGPSRARLAVESLEGRVVPSTFMVTNTRDDGSVGSLRWAVGQANGSPGSRIDFDTSGIFATARTITLTQGKLELTGTRGTETVTGPAAGVTISGNNASRVLQVDSGVTAALSGLTLTGGTGEATGEFNDNAGGGLANFGTTTLTHCAVNGNNATGTFEADGGGVYNAGALTMTGCTVSANNASGSADGNGGGIDNGDYGTLTMTGCTISGNNAPEGYGGGVYNSGAVVLTGCTVSANSTDFGSGGGLANQTDYFAAQNLGAPVATMALTNCTVNGNSAFDGGGVVNGPAGDAGADGLHYGSVTLTNCTVANNIVRPSPHPLYLATTAGGGVLNAWGNTTMINCTVTGNQGGRAGSGAGISSQYFIPAGPFGEGVSGGGNFYVRNTIISGNVNFDFPVLVPDDVGGVFFSQGNNLIGVALFGTPPLVSGASSGWVATDLIGSDARLAPLGNYGGPTQTEALLPGSPAIGAGASGPGIPTTDQRGLGRVGATDIGAVESHGYTFATVSGTPQSAYAGFTFANLLSAKLTENGFNAPLPGAVVNFTAPARGPGLTVTSIPTAITDENGVASPTSTDVFGRTSPINTANDQGGDYVVTATALDVPTAVAFSLHNIPVTSVAVTPTDPSILDGLTQRFTATATYADGATHDITNNAFITWASAMPSVATITGAGLASAFVGGEQFTTRTSVITASMGGVTSPGDTLTVRPVPSHTYTVTNTADGGGGSLRAAIDLSNSNYGHNTIVFDPAVFGTTPRTITLTSGTLIATTVAYGNLDIPGPGPGLLTVSGSAADQFLTLFDFTPGTTASLSGMTVTGGSDPGLHRDGKGVHNDGTLAMTDVVLLGGAPALGAVVVGVENTGAVTMTDCTVRGYTNRFADRFPAYGVLNSGTMSMTGCTVADTGTGWIGQPAFNEAGVYNGGTLDMVNSTVTGCDGYASGGVYNGGMLDMTGCTVSRNVSYLVASGGITNGGKLTLHNSIVAYNVNPLYRPGSSEFFLAGDISGAVESTSSNNLIGNAGGVGADGSPNPFGLRGITNGVNGNRIGAPANPINPLLGPLADHGGPTPTMALLPGSPAIDAGGNSAIPAGITTDQRGFARISRGTVDIGAFEVQPLATTTAVTTSAATSTYGDSVTFTATVTGPSAPTGGVNFVIDGGASVAGTADGTAGTTAAWTFTTSALTAGTHTVQALFVAAGDFAASDAALSGDQVVNKANATVVVTPYGVTYDGNSHTATYTITGVDGETGATVGTVTLNTTHTGANPSGYGDSWSFTGAANYHDIASTAITDVINKASSTTTVMINGGPFTYSGLAQTPATVTVTGAGALSLTPTASYANNVNAGTATASYTYAGDANHEASSESKTFTIGKADAAVLVSGYGGGTYDGSAHTQTVTVTGVPSDGRLSSTSLTGTNAGGYSQPWSYSNNGNYNPVSGSLDFTIAKANATVVVTPYGVTYDGGAHTATVSAITGVNGETGATVGNVTLNTTHTSAGTYASDSWSFAGAANYNDIAGTPITDVINKAALTITANNDSKIYGTLKTFSGTAFTESGLVAGDTITGATEASAGTAATAAVGTYAIVPSAATGTGLSNYTISYVNGTLTVFPPITAPTTVQTAYENVNRTVGGISIASGLSGSLTLTLGVSHGTLTLGTTSGLTVTGNGTGSVTAAGTTANLNAALASLVYRGSLNYFGSDTLSVTLSNNGISFSAGVAITVVSIAQQATDIQAQVSALQTAGVLNTGQANSLIVKLNDLRGSHADKFTIGKVQAFLSEVAAYRNAGVLTQAQADALSYWGNLLLLGVSRQ